MPNLEDFTFYSDKLVSGDVIKNETTIIDGQGNNITLFTTILNLYNKPPDDDSRILVGQSLWNYQRVIKNTIRYALNDKTYFFEDGSINVEWNNFNFTLGTPIVATIIYGTGKYLGAKGFLFIDVKERQLDTCKNDLFTFVETFKFTN